MISILRVVLLLACFVAAKAAHSHSQSLNPFNGTDLSALDERTRSVLIRAGEDFERVALGKEPIHAVIDRDAPLPTDGGTSYWLGDGYRLTIVQELSGYGRREAAAHGFLYGPILILDKSVSPSNDSNPTYIRFYTFDQFQRFKRRASKTCG